MNIIIAASHWHRAHRSLVPRIVKQGALFISIVFLLLTAPFAAISITFSSTFGYSSTSSSVANLSIRKEIPAQVKNFILNQVVNKSKAAIVVGFVDPNGTRVFSFGICQSLC